MIRRMMTRIIMSDANFKVRCRLVAYPAGGRRWVYNVGSSADLQLVLCVVDVAVIVAVVVDCGVVPETDVRCVCVLRTRPTGTGARRVVILNAIIGIVTLIPGC
jgi:hypothetical protein